MFGMLKHRSPFRQACDGLAAGVIVAVIVLAYSAASARWFILIALLAWITWRVS